MATKAPTKAASKAATKSTSKAKAGAAAKPAAGTATRTSTSAGRRRGGGADAATKPDPKPALTPVPTPDRATDAAATAGADTPPAAGDPLRRPDLIEAVAARVSLKRSEAKMVFDVVLDEIGKALDSRDDVVLPPLGKLMVKKRVEKPGGAMLTVKLKRAGTDPAAGDVAPLAKAGEEG